MDLNEVLTSIPLSELLETVTSKARKSSKDVCSYIRAIFEGSTETSDESENRRFETFKSSLMILQTTELSLNTTSELVSLLLMKVDSLCTSNLMKIAEFFVDQVLKTSNLNSKCLEIYTKVLLCLSQRDSIVYQGSDMSGLDLRKNVIMSLFSEELPVSCIVQIISILKEIDLVEDEMKLVSNSLLRSLEDIDPVELPPFIYQLLLLSTKGDCKRILQGVLAYFIKNDHRLQGNEVDNCFIDDNNEIQFRQMEGTAVFFLSVASSHDRTIGKEFTILFKKLLHMPELVLSPFMFASALSLSKVQTNKDDLFESLKKTLSNAYQLNKKKSNSLWMRETMVSKLDVLDLVKEAIKSSGFGWDHICQGLVKFGFSVIETFGPKSVCGHTTKPVSVEGCALGSHILLDTFKSHRIVRTDIVDELLNRVVTKSQKPVQHYIDIFSQLVHKDSLFLLEVLPKLVEMLDYIHFLPHKNAVAILQALTPLLRISMPLKDTLMLVLRKALFHRDVEARKVAVSGYLILLKKLNSIGKVTLSQSQSCISSQASSASMISTQIRADVYVSSRNATSQAMCLEIMGLMKRVLTQQCCVRQLLYQGLYEITLKNKPLTSIVLELLLGGFEKYYVSDEEADVPLLFEACYKEHNGTLVLEEPLSDLIKSVHLTLLDAEEVSEDEEGDVSARKMLLESLHSLSSRLSEANSDVLEISKKTDDDAPSVDVRSELVLSVYEALLEFTLLHMVDYNVEDCEKLLQLYYRYKENYEKVNEKKKTAKKSTKSKTSPTFPPIAVSIRYFAMIMEGLFTDGTFKHQQGLNLLRSDAAFVTNTIRACNQKLSKLSESGVDDGFSEVMGSFYYLIKIARVYFKTYNDGLNFTFSSLEWEKMSLLFADGLAYIFTYVNSFQAKNSEKFILGICNDISCSTVQATQIALKTIQKSIMKLLADTENDLNLKETVPLLSVIRTLYELFTKDIGEDLFKWLKQLCSQQVFQNTVVAKSFVALCLTLGHQTKHISTLLREMAFDIHYHLDDIDPDENVQGSTKYNILTADVSRSVIQNVISNSEVILDEVECALNILKSNISVPAELLSLASENSQNQSTAEGCISVRLSELILVFHELVQTSVPLDNTSGVIFKLIAKFYRILGSLTKYYLLLHTKSKTAELHTNFEKLVKLSHTKLTTQVYSFITYIQTSSEGNKKKTKSLVAAQKAMRDMKTVPALVFNIESYEKNLILVSKKYNKNLMNHMKLSTARDFRINPNVILSSLEQSQESEASTVQNGDENEAENESSNENQDDETVVNSNETSLEPDDEERPSASVSTRKPSSSSKVKNSASNASSRSKLSRSVSKKLKTSNDTTLNNTHAERTEIINENMEVDEKENEDAREDKVKPVKRKRLGVRGNTKKAK